MTKADLGEEIKHYMQYERKIVGNDATFRYGSSRDWRARSESVTELRSILKKHEESCAAAAAAAAATAATTAATATDASTNITAADAAAEASAAHGATPFDTDTAKLLTD